MTSCLPRWKPFDAALLVASTGVAVAGLLGLGFQEYGWAARLTVLAAGLVLAGLAVFIVGGRIVRNQREIARYVAGLCQQDLRNFRVEDAADFLFPISADNPWKPAAQQLQDFLHRVQEQLREYEHGRSKAEVRCHRLDLERRQLSEVVAALSEPIVAIDQFDEIVLTNPSADRLLQIKGDRDERRVLQNLVRCEELVQLLSETRRRPGPTRKTADIEIDSPSGERMPYRAVVRDLRLGGRGGVDQNRQPQGAVAVLRNVSREKDSQKRHAEFVSAVSHEMKTPLAGIKAYVELLADGDAEDEETREEFLEVINGQADRLQRLIDNLLNLARIEAGVVEIQKRPLPLNEVLEEALRVLQPAAEEKQVRLTAELSALYLGVHIDRDMLLQAAINLLSNAVKYTPSGGRVTLRSGLRGDLVEFEVTDTGVGLSEEDCVKVFDKFYRVKSHSQMARGTGLGLPLAKHIVQDVHGGELTVESVPGKGSTFRVVLPAVEKHD